MWLLYFIGKENKDNTTTTDLLYNEADRCPICLNCLLEKEVGFPESCNHVFCMTCILKWAEVSLRINIKYYSILVLYHDFILPKDTGFHKLFYSNVFPFLWTNFIVLFKFWQYIFFWFSFIKNLNTYLFKKTLQE